MTIVRLGAQVEHSTIPIAPDRVLLTYMPLPSAFPAFVQCLQDVAKSSYIDQAIRIPSGSSTDPEERKPSFFCLFQDAAQFSTPKSFSREILSAHKSSLPVRTVSLSVASSGKPAATRSRFSAQVAVPRTSQSARSLTARSARSTHLAHEVKTRKLISA